MELICRELDPYDFISESNSRLFQGFIDHNWDFISHIILAKIPLAKSNQFLKVFELPVNALSEEYLRSIRELVVYCDLPEVHTNPTRLDPCIKEDELRQELMFTLEHLVTKYISDSNIIQRIGKFFSGEWLQRGLVFTADLDMSAGKIDLRFSGGSLRQHDLLMITSNLIEAGFNADQLGDIVFILRSEGNLTIREILLLFSRIGTWASYVSLAEFCDKRHIPKRGNQRKNIRGSINAGVAKINKYLSQGETIHQLIKI